MHTLLYFSKKGFHFSITQLDLQRTCFRTKPPPKVEDPCFRTNFTKYHCISILGWRVLVSNHISLDQISSHLTTFLSKHGTYPSEIRFWLDLPKSSDISPILCETVHPAQFLPKPTHSHTQARIMLSRPKSAPADLLLMTMCAIPWAHYAHTVSPVHEARIIDRDFITESLRQTVVQNEFRPGTPLGSA